MTASFKSLILLIFAASNSFAQNNKLDELQGNSFDILVWASCKADNKTGTAYIAIDTSGTITDVSVNFLRKLGYSKDEVVGRNFLYFVAEKDLTATLMEWNRFVEVITPVGNFTNRYMKANGGIIQVEWKYDWMQYENHVWKFVVTLEAEQ